MPSTTKYNVKEAKCVNNYSRHTLLSWVNMTLSSNYKKIEELCSGIAYCQLLNNVFPGTVQFKKVKDAAKLEHEYMENFKILQSGFTKLKIDKEIQIERLVKGRFLDNLNFLQWFKNFYDVNCPNDNNTAGELISISNKDINENLNTLKPFVRTDTYDVIDNKDDKLKTINVLLDNITELKALISSSEADRDFYNFKLKMIETLIEDEKIKGNENSFTQAIFDVLYSEDEVDASSIRSIKLSENALPLN